MLPKSLQGSYTRYKDDTNSLATWLLEAANKCGYQPDDLASTAPPLNSKESKDKNRKKQENVSSNPVQYKTTVKNLQVLADVVAKSSLTVPRPIIAIAKRAIKLRKHVTSWFLGKGDTEENERHAHFVSALERVCETLEWKASKFPKPDAKQPRQTADSKDHDADIGTFLNRFAVLTVEEPSEAHTSEQEQIVTSKPQKVVKVELMENDEDEAENYEDYVFFKALCLFQDLQNMRGFISDTWSEYRDKKIDLMNAALVTDGALKLAKSLVQEVLEAWDASPLSSVWNIQQFFFHKACDARDIRPPLSDDFSSNKDVADLADLSYLPTWLILRSFSHTLKWTEILAMKKGYFGVHNPKANREVMSPRQKSNEDSFLLLEFLLEFRMIYPSFLRCPFVDSITGGLIEFFRTKKINTWLCFASQIYLDIYHLMRHSTLSAFDDLRMSGLRIKKVVEDYFKFCKTHPELKFWTKESDEPIQALNNAVHTLVDKDQLFEILCSDFPEKGPFEKHAFISRSPVMCGLSSFFLNTWMQDLGQRLVNSRYDVRSLAFLYNLVNAQSHKSTKWPDMETFIKIHGESHIFVGSRPKNASESSKQFNLATGEFSAARFARDARNRPHLGPDRKDSIPLKRTTTITEILETQYLQRSGESGDIGNIEKVLDKLSQELSSKSSGIGLQSSNSQVMFQRKGSHAHKIDALQIFALMKSRLAEEEPMVLFNYFGMHQRCIEILRLIQGKEHQEFLRHFDSPSSYMHFCDGPSISSIALLVLQIAEATDESLKLLRFVPPVSSDSYFACRLVISCGEVMKEYLQRNGDVACKELRVFCKNKKPFYDAIDYDKESSDTDDFICVDIEKTMDPKTLASLETGIPVA
ncbi:uncharacterized protein N7483_008588 [Penicillium malachiteum]|uniref:uncharacterized protein n=1 Tax=Penicillium malachiteum TaxID=1324776 RepID=UPI0025471017|nr:uncharacterized protein N7483_008588 [Penicillium malachiteum]KAJ5720654.1 hypothetical protein N7483_008588 [Penicillium malachiteum]